MTKITKNLLITLVVLIPVAGSGVATYYYIIGKDNIIDDNVNKIEIGTIIQDGGTLNMPNDRFKAPTKDEISDQIIKIYGQETEGFNSLEKEDFEIITKINPEQKPGFDIEIAAKGDKYLGKTKQIIGYKKLDNIELSSHITVTQIGPKEPNVSYKYNEIPDEKQFIEDIKAKNPSLDTSLIKGELKLDNNNEDLGFYIITPIEDTNNPYVGSVKVGFTLKTQITKMVGEKIQIKQGLNDTEKPTLEEIKRQITVETNLFATDFDIKEVTINSKSFIPGKEFIVELKAKGDNYRGETQMEVKWQWVEFEELSEVITETTIPEKFNKAPSSEEVLDKVSRYNWELQKEYVTYGEPKITGDNGSMTISANKKDENPYVGEVTVAFAIKKDIANVLENNKEIDFGRVIESPSIDDIREKILNIDPNLSANNYSITIVNSKTWSDKEFIAKIKTYPSSEDYSGAIDVKIKFEQDDKIDLKEHLKVTSLKTNFENIPTEEEVINELVKQNPLLKPDGINATSISKTLAIISPKIEENYPYNGENITVYFNTQQSLEETIKEEDRFAGYFGVGNIDDDDTKEGIKGADNLVKTKVGEEQFKLLKKETIGKEEDGIIKYSVEDTVNSNYKGSVTIEWDYRRHMQDALEMINAFKGGTIGYRSSGAAAWNYATEVLNNSTLKGRWTIAWDYDKTKSKGTPIKISPLHSGDKDGLIGSGWINWNEQEELNSQFPGDKAFAGYFGNGSEDQASKQMAYDGVDKYVSEAIGQDQLKHLSRTEPSVGRLKYVAQNSPETQFKNTTTISWKFNQKTQDYINSLSGFENGSIGWHANGTEAFDYTKSHLDKSELVDSYDLKWEGDDLIITLKKQDIGFVGDAKIKWGLVKDIQKVIKDNNLESIGWFKENDDARLEAEKRLDATELKDKYDIKFDSKNDLIITPSTSEFVGTATITWKRSKDIRKFIVDNKLDDLGWMENETKAKEEAIKKLDATDLKNKYNIELDSKNDLIITPSTSEFFGEGKITWKRSKNIQVIINKAQISNVGWADTEDEAIKNAKVKLDKTDLKDKYEIKYKNESQLEVRSKTNEFIGVGIINWSRSSPLQTLIDLWWSKDGVWFETKEAALKEAGIRLQKAIGNNGKIEMGKDNVIRATDSSGRYSGVAVMKWNQKIALEKAVKDAGINLKGWYAGKTDKNDWGSDELDSELRKTLDPTMKDQYEIEMKKTNVPIKNRGEKRDITLHTKFGVEKYFGSFSYQWNAKINIVGYINDKDELRDLGNILGIGTASKEAMAEAKLRLDKDPLIRGKYWLDPFASNGIYSIWIKPLEKYKYQFDGDYAKMFYKIGI